MLYRKGLVTIVRTSPLPWGGGGGGGGGGGAIFQNV